MKINKNFNNYKTHFHGTKQKDTKMPNLDSAMHILMKGCKDELYKHAEYGVPENGIFGKVSIEFVVPKSNNEGLFYITHSAEDPKTQRVLSVGVHHKNSDRMISNMLLKGTKNEILENLKSEDNVQELVDIVKDLSDKTDDYHSSL